MTKIQFLKVTTFKVAICKILGQIQALTCVLKYQYYLYTSNIEALIR